MPSCCIVPGCKAKSIKNDRKRIFHAMPNELDMSIKWLHAIGLPHYAKNLNKDKKGWYRVCSDHFDDSCYHMRRRLLKTAVPTLNRLPLCDKSTETNHAPNTQTNSDAKPEHSFKVISNPGIGDKLTKADEDDTFTINEHTLRIEINRRAELGETISARRTSKLEKFLKCSRKFLGPETSKLITCQMLIKEHYKKKFAARHKLFCLDLYYHNPRAYRFLQQFISLPPIATLKNLYLNVNSGSVSPRCLQILRSMVAQMNTKDRCCIVGIASTKLKKHVYYDIRNDTVHGIHQANHNQWKVPAKKACAIVVKGLLSSWQMPVAFALLQDSDVVTLRRWSDSIIQILICYGLDVRAFVSNQCDTDYKLLSELRNISSEKNFFVLMGKTIYNIFDVKSLVTSLRDTLMSSDMSIAFEGVATWKHILTFYNTDKLQMNLAAGLTSAHVNPDENQKSSTDHAVQLFSKTVATAMKVFLRLKLLEEGANATVNLINRVSDLLVLLNLDPFKNYTLSKTPFTGEERQELLKELLVYFKGVRQISDGVLLDCKAESIAGLIVTIKSMFDLWKSMSDDGDCNLKTQSLNLEFVDDCFREICTHNKKRKNKCDQVTTIEFIRGFNKAFLNNVVKNARLNSLKNFNSSLSKLHDYLTERITGENHLLDLDAKNNALHIDNLENKIILPKENVLRYLAGYLMKKALEKHSSCVQLIGYLTPSNRKSNTFIDCYYLEMKVPVDFVIFVVKMEHIFITVFEDIMPREVGVGARALKAMKPLVILPCRCFPLLLIKKLFVRIRIYNAVKDINRQLKTTDVLFLK